MHPWVDFSRLTLVQITLLATEIVGVQHRPDAAAQAQYETGVTIERLISRLGPEEVLSARAQPCPSK